MRLCFVFGTRPEIIKISPIIRYLIEREIPFELIHTNQHYSQEMDSIFFKELELPAPNYNLNIGSSDHGTQTGRMIVAISKALKRSLFTDCIVQGDTNSTLSGAIVSSKLKISLSHVEAGLRSYDRKMPEEINRIITDHVSDLLFVPTKIQENILLKENINQNKIFQVGNTITDAINENLPIAIEKSTILEKLDLKSINYGVLTLHRPSNVDDPSKLKQILHNLSLFIEGLNKSIIFPLHPRTRKVLQKNSIEMPKGIQIIDPVGYLDMLVLLKNSDVILTDSGGLQEEGCILKKPVITLRENTERPETVDAGMNKIVGSSLQQLMNTVPFIENFSPNSFNIPYERNTTMKIMKTLESQ